MNRYSAQTSFAGAIRNTASEVHSQTSQVYGEPISIYTNITRSEAKQQVVRSKTSSIAPTAITAAPRATIIEESVSFFVGLIYSG